ncbi:threonine/homoserine/homoserine lactone efflux protein [Rhodopseudomonas faecalis]|uniref:Threonine/homoserine/homoserine lactone efflux protein n=1 Tax=Rhodopseudomonas faecalis TaxID=99655 RepID=A0A318TMP4_9BRAD|nr:threonine/homoserine/homoserine lactone efflux protein [Rhodopseudomonas faecalis]
MGRRHQSRPVEGRLLSDNLTTLVSIGLVQLLAVISPGPSFLITAKTAVSRSSGDGIKLALGLGLGTVVWATAALLGLNALFAAMPMLFSAMKVMGALFLLWIALQIFRHAASAVDLEHAAGAGSQHLILKGFMTQLSNPKVVVFFGSVFVAMLPADPSPWMVAALVVIVTLNEVVWYSLVALFIGQAGVRARYLRAKTWIDRGTSVFLGGLGLRLLLSARS